MTPWTGRTEKLDKRWRKTRLQFFREDLKNTLEALWQPNWTILDVGCGSAILYEHLDEKIKPYYVGLDFTKEFLVSCDLNHPDAHFVYGDVLELEIASKFYHIVNSTAVLQHIIPWRRALAEMVRVARHYVVTTTRIQDKPTSISPVTEVHTWRFNIEEVLAEHEKYGSCTWEWAIDSAGLRNRIGIFTLKLDEKIR